VTAARDHATVPWPVRFCEQCGARFETRPGQRKPRTEPLRTCPGCHRLSCRECWPSRTRKCVECRGQAWAEGTAVATPATTEPEVTPAVAVPAAAAAPPLPIAQPAARRTSRSPRPGPGPADPATARVATPVEPPPDDPEPARAATDGRSGPRRPVIALVAALGLLAIAIVAVLGGRPSPPGTADPTGDVAGLAATPSGSGAPSTDAAPADPSATAPGGGASQPPPSAAPTPIPSGPGVVTATDEQLRVWTDALGEVRAQVVIVGTNTGGEPVVVEESASRWSVLDPAGTTVASGRFARSIPAVVAPGGSVVLVETLSATLADAAELATLEAQVVTRPAGEEAAGSVVTLDVSDVAWEAGPDGAIAVTGRVRNDGDASVSDVQVAVVLRDSDGAVLAAAYDVSIDALDAGETREFTTSYPGTPPIEPSEVVSAEAVAAGSR
jgi:hypothetical protein